MKKNYLKPETLLFDMEVHLLETISAGGTTDDPNDILSREASDWDD